MLFLLFALCSAQQLVPVPSPIDGFLLGPASTNYTIDVFYDHLCKNSSAGYNGLMEYWEANSQWLGLRIHIYPLPRNLYSFIAAQSGRFIQLKYPSKFLLYLSYIFSHQSLITDQVINWDLATANYKIAQYTQQATGVSFTEIQNALSDSTYSSASVVSWKYAASRRMTGTPSYLVNEVWAPEVTAYTTKEQWASFFKSLNS